MKPLPIDPLLDELTERLARNPALIVEAAPGAGKTTRVPWALLEAGLAKQNEILIVQPRRLAARLAASYVAAEHGEPLGQTVGYSVRFEDVSGPRTRLRYLTEGVLLRRLLADPSLRQVAVVILDEFHERHLATDLLLALVRRAQQTSHRALKLVVMSATLQTDELASLLEDCPQLRSEGQLHPVSIEHLPRPDARALELQVLSAVKRVLREGPTGDILVFLPGAAEIARCAAALTPLASSHDIAVLPLHGDLPLAQQALAVAPSHQRKIVLSTNVAESSVTIDGVTAVIDSGLGRVRSYSAWNGVPRLATLKVSRAAARQRAGRAGRTRPGRVLRLYTQGDYDARREHARPEIERQDLCETLLLLRGMSIANLEQLDWLTPPPARSYEAAQSLLEALGAVAGQRELTAIGRRMLGFPLHPRLSRLLVEGERQAVLAAACLAAALLGEHDIRLGTRTRLGREPSRHAAASGPSDVTELMDRFEEARACRLRPGQLQALGFDTRAVHAVARAERQLRRLTSARGPAALADDGQETAVRKCVLAGFADRVARRRRPGQRELVLSSGASARLSEQSVVHAAPLLVAVDAEEQARGRTSATIVRLASAIEPEWLLDLHPQLLEATDQLQYNAVAKRVERVSRIACGSVVLEESRDRAPPSAEAARLLAQAARGTELGRLGSRTVAALLARIELLREQAAELGWPELGADQLQRALERACAGRVSLEELERVDLAAELVAMLSPAQRQVLQELAPTQITLPSGRVLQVQYEPDRPPWIASRLQDFFGMTDPPRIAQGRVPLTLHLLAPNQRAVQVTADLAGFWQRHYGPIRRELMRRYPKHSWPQDGATATPPAPAARRKRQRR